MLSPPSLPRGERSRSGLSLVELTIALAIITVVLSASASAFVTNLSAARTAESLSQGTLFLETVLEDLSAQAYDDLLAFDGNRIFDQEDEASSRYSATLTVFEAEAGLLQVVAVLTDLRTDRDLGRLTTFRSPR